MSSRPKLLQLVAVLPWGHNLLLINKVESLEAVEFYANEIILKGWSRDWLLNAIKMDSYSQAQKQIQSHNFNETLPAVHSDYANKVFKNSYNLGFLGITEQLKETELEKRLVEKYKQIAKTFNKEKMILCHRFVGDYLQGMPSSSIKYTLEIKAKKGEETDIFKGTIQLSSADENISEYLIIDNDSEVRVLLYYKISYYL